MAWTNRIFGFAIAATIYLLDQAIKGVMVGPLQLRERDEIYLLPFFNLKWTQNFGVSLGMFSASSPEMLMMLIGLTGLIAAVVVVWMLREQAFVEIAALGLILGGALGNIHDRATLGYVIDYADLHIGEFRPFLIFNLADAAITIGVLIILARSFFLREKEGEAADDAAPDHDRADRPEENPDHA